ISQFLENVKISVEHVETGHVFDITVTEFLGEESAKVRIADRHTNIVLIEKNGQTLFEKELEEVSEKEQADRGLLNMQDIWEFVQTVDTEDVKELLER